MTIRVTRQLAIAFVVTAGAPVFLLLYVVTVANDATLSYGSSVGEGLPADKYSYSDLVRLLRNAEDQNNALRRKLSSLPGLASGCADGRLPSEPSSAGLHRTSGHCSHCANFQLPLPRCQVIHIAIVCAGYNATRDAVTLLKSILIYRRNLLHLHFLSDAVARLILGELMRTWALSGVHHSFYSIEDYKDRVAWVPNRHYSGVYGLLKLLLPDVLPAALGHVIVLDTDVTLSWDVAELWSHARLLRNGTHAVAAVENLSDWYLGTIWKEHRPWPALGRGFNTGVMLMNLTTLRLINWSSLWREVTRQQLLNHTATQLADQDIINAASVKRPDLMRALPCDWNVQLSKNARLSDLCPLREDEVKAIHLNSPDKARAHSGLADHFRSLYAMFVEYDGKLLRQQPATHGCSSESWALQGAAATGGGDSSNSVDGVQPSAAGAASAGAQQEPWLRPAAAAAAAATAGSAEDDYSDEASECLDFGGEQSVSHRTHLYYVQYGYGTAAGDVLPSAVGRQQGGAVGSGGRLLPDDDVTLVAQLSIDRLQMLESLCAHWPGPMSLALYMSDGDTRHFLQYVQDSEVLSLRRNVGFHVVFRDGKYYPVNRLRNIALRQVQTSYAFLSDIDFLPMHGLYEYLVESAKMHDLANQRKALVVPAFETQRYHLSFPSTKAELLSMLDAGAVSPFRLHIWPKGHAPTNFTLWREAVLPYQVRWKPDFEPYVLVNKRSAAEYDERFVGFGWNKVSHIMELDAQGFAFVVLPNAFVIHMPHAPSFDIAKYRTSATYRRCLKLLKMEFQKDLSRRYGVRALKYLSAD